MLSQTERVQLCYNHNLSNCEIRFCRQSCHRDVIAMSLKTFWLQIKLKSFFLG